MLFSKLSPNGKMICFFFNTGELDIYSTQTHLPIATMAANNIVSDACFDASGDTLFTCSSKSSAVHLWDMRNQKSFAFLQDDNFYGNTSLALSPKEKLLSLGNSSGALNLYSIANPVAEFENKNIIKPTKTLSNLTYSCENIIFSPKTNLMFYSSSQGENSAKLVILTLITKTNEQLGTSFVFRSSIFSNTCYFLLIYFNIFSFYLTI